MNRVRIGKYLILMYFVSMNDNPKDDQGDMIVDYMKTLGTTEDETKIVLNIFNFTSIFTFQEALFIGLNSIKSEIEEYEKVSLLDIMSKLINLEPEVTRKNMLDTFQQSKKILF